MAKRTENPRELIARYQRSLYRIIDEIVKTASREDRDEIFGAGERLFALLDAAVDQEKSVMASNIVCLTWEQIKEVKRLLWHGYSQTQIGLSFGVTQPTISKIASGYSGREVEWPDNSVGRFPPYRKTELRMANALPIQMKHIPDAVQDPLINKVAKEVQVMDRARHPLGALTDEQLKHMMHTGEFPEGDM